MSEKEIKKLLREPMSNVTIKKITGCNIIHYDKLANVKDIDKYIKNNAVIIFIPNCGSDVGHWVCIVVNKKKDLITYFNSYGKEPYGNIAKVLYDSKYKNIEYNHHCFQGDDTSTCGRHVVIRILGAQRDTDEYIHALENAGDIDVFVSYVVKKLFGV